MEIVAASLRELVIALGLQGRASEIEAVARSLLATHDGIAGDDTVARQRPENKALAACYIAANYVLLPERVSYEAMCKAAAQTAAWRAEAVPGKNGMTKLIKRFARRIGPIDHEPEVIERGGMLFTVCTHCHYVLHTGGFAGQEDEAKVAEPITVPGKRKGGLHASTDTRDRFESILPVAPILPAGDQVVDEAAGKAEETTDEAVPGEETVPDETVPGEEAATGETVPDQPSTGPAEIRAKWLASAGGQAKKLAKQFPALKPAVPGAVALLKRSIDTYITSDKVQGSLVQKLARLALLHEAKAGNIPVTTKDLNVAPTDYLQFLARSGASAVPVSAADDAVLVDQALAAITRFTGQSIDSTSRDRITRFQAATRRKLMGFSPGMVAAVLAFIDLARHDPGVNLAKIAAAAGVNTSSFYNAAGRFLDKVGRAGDPSASMVERVRAAFPLRD
jgi:hypothetical protein